MIDDHEVDVEQDGDEIILKTDHCILYQCQYWERGKLRPTKPKLIIDDNGFMTCPKCNCSYGKQDNE